MASKPNLENMTNEQYLAYLQSIEDKEKYVPEDIICFKCLKVCERVFATLYKTQSEIHLCSRECYEAIRNKKKWKHLDAEPLARVPTPKPKKDENKEDEVK